MTWNMLKRMLLFVGLLKLILINAEIEKICENHCREYYLEMVDIANNGRCNEAFICPLGHDCNDCGDRGHGCTNDCSYSMYYSRSLEYNTVCNDGSECSYGYDCGDCGPRYVVYDPCWEGPCGANGQCQANGNSYTCLCDAGYSGEQCDAQTIDEVMCTADGVTVTVAADDFPFGNTMLLGGDANCAGIEIIENGIMYYRFTSPDFESCGLSIVNTTDNSIVYHTFLVEGAISVVDIYCNMERRVEVYFNITANPCIITATLEGFGTFDFVGTVYEDDNFTIIHDPDVPVDMCDGTDIYFGIEVDYNGDDIELFVEHCYVTDDPDDVASPEYYLITNGCHNADYDVEPSDGNELSPLKKNYQFSAYEFVYTNGMTMLYIRCEAVICDSADANSRCSQGCLFNRMKRGEHTSESTIITQGPYAIQGCA